MCVCVRARARVCVQAGSDTLGNAVSKTQFLGQFLQTPDTGLEMEGATYEPLGIGPS